MKFHLKMTLCMLAVLAALFGAGGSLLISESFEDSLEREKTAALGDYRMAWGTLQIVNSMDTYLTGTLSSRRWSSYTSRTAPPGRPCGCLPGMKCCMRTEGRSPH